MPTIITATELRSVLGVSSALYDDTYLNGIIDTAENTILPMLVTFKSPIQKTILNDNVATYGSSSWSSVKAIKSRRHEGTIHKRRNAAGTDCLSALLSESRDGTLPGFS